MCRYEQYLILVGSLHSPLNWVGIGGGAAGGHSDCWSRVVGRGVVVQSMTLAAAASISRCGP